METPNENESDRRSVPIKHGRASTEGERAALSRWENEGGQNGNQVKMGWAGMPGPEGDRPNPKDNRKTPVFQVGDTVIHWTFGNGKIVAILDKGIPEQPCFYYIIEGQGQTLWVPVDEDEKSNLHLPVSPDDFWLLVNNLHGKGEKMSSNSYQRLDQLEERMQKATVQDVCLVIRDLTHSARRQKLSSSESRILKHARSLLLDEWQRSLGTPRERARKEMESMLNDRR